MDGERTVCIESFKNAINQLVTNIPLEIMKAVKIIKNFTSFMFGFAFVHFFKFLDIYTGQPCTCSKFVSWNFIHLKYVIYS